MNVVKERRKKKKCAHQHRQTTSYRQGKQCTHTYTHTRARAHKYNTDYWGEGQYYSVEMLREENVLSLFLKEGGVVECLTSRGRLIQM